MALYGNKTFSILFVPPWSLTLQGERKLQVFESRILCLGVCLDEGGTM